MASNRRWAWRRSARVGADRSNRRGMPSHGLLATIIISGGLGFHCAAGELPRASLPATSPASFTAPAGLIVRAGNRGSNPRVDATFDDRLFFGASHPDTG